MPTNEWDNLNLNGFILNGLRLRLARESDLPFIREVWFHPTTLQVIPETREFSERTLNKLWAENPATSDVRHFMVENLEYEEAVAYLRLCYPFNEPGCLWLTFLVVAPQLRNQGYGRKIMQLLLASVKNNECISKFGVHTLASNHHAAYLYESSGFECIAREQMHTPEGSMIDRLTFCMNLEEDD